jgi:hypothetical protein
LAINFIYLPKARSVYKELKPTGERMDDCSKGYFIGLTVSCVVQLVIALILL